MIKHQDGKWVLFSKDGSKRLGEFPSEQAAKDREAQIIAAQAAQESYAEQRDLSTEVWARDITEAAIDGQGNLSGIVVVEGESKNGNVYTLAALESGPQIFAGVQIFADHPSLSEQRDRPERSLRGLVGKLSESPDDFWVDTVREGPHQGKHALFYHNGILSETADWLATMIREKIAGAQSINATGGGDMNQEGKFQVEAFLSARSLDFVTIDGAGGKGQLQESDRDDTTQTINEDQVIATFLESMTIGDLAKLRPDIIDGIGTRERAKVYGKRNQILQEATMSKALLEEVRRLRASVGVVTQQSRRQRATAALNGLLAESSLPANAHAHVRQLVEGSIRRFIEQEEEPMAAEGEVTAAIVTSPDLDAGDPPIIEVPAEVPPEKAADWVKAYLEATEAGAEPAQAVHVAWAAIINGGGEVEIPEDVGGAMVDTFTEAQLAEAFRQAILGEAKYLSTVTGAGSVTGMGGADAQALLEQAPQVDEKAEKESWIGLGLTEAGAAVAMRGRGRNL